MQKLKHEDEVIVIAGKDKGKNGKLLQRDRGSWILVRTPFIFVVFKGIIMYLIIMIFFGHHCYLVGDPIAGWPLHHRK